MLTFLVANDFKYKFLHLKFIGKNLEISSRKEEINEFLTNLFLKEKNETQKSVIDFITGNKEQQKKINYKTCSYVKLQSTKKHNIRKKILDIRKLYYNFMSKNRQKIKNTQSLLDFYVVCYYCLPSDTFDDNFDNANIPINYHSVHDLKNISRENIFTDTIEKKSKTIIRLGVLILPALNDGKLKEDNSTRVFDAHQKSEKFTNDCIDLFQNDD
ncbi:hypothetical protein COBT_000404 [Conglomerata obtusa]